MPAPRWSALLIVTAVACQTQPESAGAEPETKTEAAPAAPVKVRTVTAEARKVPSVTTWLGSLAAERTARVAADANGVITSVNVDRGDTISAGQTIAIVDTRMAQLQVDASAAQVALAKAQSKAAEADCIRAAQLEAGGAMAAATADRTRAACEAQARAVDAAQSQAKIMQTQLAKALVKAPFSGVVAERNVQLGEMVGAASPVITLVTIDPLRVRFAVPERDLAAIAEGGEIRVRVPALDETATGKILPLPPVTREATRDMLVEATVPNPNGKLRGGLSAWVDVVHGEVDAVVVPTTAVLTDDTTHRMFKIKDGHAVEILVHAEPGPAGMFVVSGGPPERPVIVAGDVVIDAPLNLRDGAAVE